MTRTKFVTIESYGIIHALGGIMGPVTSPCNLDISVIISLINSGKMIYEVNPKNITEKVLLTRDNVLKDNFNSSVVKENAINNIKPSKTSSSAVTKPQVTHKENKTEIIKPREDKLGIDLFISNKKS